VRLSAFNTPYGDAQLDPVGVPRDVRQKLVWEELEYRMQKGLSVQVGCLCAGQELLLSLGGLCLESLWTGSTTS